MKKDLDSTHVFQNGTGQQLIDSIEDVAKRLSTIAIVKSADIDLTNYEHIQKIVQLGMAKDYFEIGDQIHTTWKPDEEHEYDMPWDVVDFRPCEDPDGNIHENAMWLQSRYGLRDIITFSPCEAFYVPDKEMPAGVYHFTTGHLGIDVPYGTDLQFETTKPISANWKLMLGKNESDVPTNKLATLRVRVYETGNSDPIEVLPLSIGSNGEYIGILDVSMPRSTYGMNDYYCVNGGYNRWSQSAMRQWLNSDAKNGEWWVMPCNFSNQNIYSSPPESMPDGFMSQLASGFTKIVKPNKIITAVNDGDATASLKYDITYDRFFAPSLSELGFDGSYSSDVREGNVFSIYAEHKGTYANLFIDDLDGPLIYCVTRTARIDRRTSIYRYGRATNTSSILVSRTGPYIKHSVRPCCVIY